MMAGSMMAGARQDGSLLRAPLGRFAGGRTLVRAIADRGIPAVRAAVGRISLQLLVDHSDRRMRRTVLKASGARALSKPTTPENVRG